MKKGVNYKGEKVLLRLSKRGEKPVGGSGGFGKKNLKKKELSHGGGS